MILSDLLERYALVALSEGQSKSSISIARHSVGLLDDSLGGISDVSAVTADDLRRLIVDLGHRTKWQGTDQARAELLSTTAIITYVRRIKTFWAWLEREKIIKENVLSDVRPPKASQKLPRFFEADLINKVLKYVMDEPRELALIILILDTGITLQELTDLDDQSMNIGGLETRVFRQKTRKERVLYFCPATAAVCAAYRAVRPPPVAEPRFFLNWDGNPMTKHRVQAIFARVGKRSGIGVRLSPHKLRHTFATMSLRTSA